MEKYKVLQDFLDNETGHVYRLGDVYYVPTAERVTELLGESHPNHKGAIIAPVVSEKAEGIPTADNTVADIKAYLEAQEIDFEGVTKKADLLALIR
jgi:hypothetical protein